MMVSFSVCRVKGIEGKGLIDYPASRYTCSHPSHDEPPSFPNWTALQQHLHTAHIVTCPQPSCHGRTFKDDEKLQLHLQNHTTEPELLAKEDDIDVDMESELEEGKRKKRKKDRGTKGKKESKKVRIEEDDKQGTIIEHDTRRFACPSELIHGQSEIELKCYSRFWRIYDVKRHLNTAHGIKLDTEEVKELLRSQT